MMEEIGGDDDGRSKNKLMVVDIQILLVDDDAISLAVVSAMLRLCKYKGFIFFFCLMFLLSHLLLLTDNSTLIECT